MDRTILLVDDEENIVAALTRILRRDGYTILKAHSGAEGLEVLAKTEVGVIISDQRMPGMSGVEFLSRVRELYPDTIRIVLSGYTDLSSVTDAINRGAVYRFLTKPWEDDLLRENVQEAFLQHEMKRENARLSAALKSANEELSAINHNLELRVEEKTREAIQNLNVLRISQEILEFLPLAVVGIGQDGMLAFANRLAHSLFGFDPPRTIIGEMAADVLPAELMDALGKKGGPVTHKKVCRLGDGMELQYWCHVMGESSESRGIVAVIEASAGGTPTDAAARL